MTADEAGQTWLDRTTAIVKEYQDPNYPKDQVHDEAARAAQGINLLLENRTNDLTPQMVEWLGQAVDVNARVNQDTLDASFQSPWESGWSGFGQDVKQEVEAGVQGVKKAAADVAKKFELDFTVIAIGAIVILVLISVLERKAGAYV